MKRTLILLFLILANLACMAQDISGKWNGILNVQGTKLRIVFNITKMENGYSSTMDSPDQGAKGIPVTKTSYNNSVLLIDISNLGIKYQARINNDGNFEGIFKQAGLSIPLILSTKDIEKKKLLDHKNLKNHIHIIAKMLNSKIKKIKLS